MFKPQSIYTTVAWQTINEYLEKGNTHSMEQNQPPEELSSPQGCFVSLHKYNGSLRGCIGTITPAKENLYLEIITNAVSAIINDPRFPPLSRGELEEIVVSVDVLSTPDKVKDLSTLDPSVYGIIVTDGKFRRGVLLPGIETIDTVEKQIISVKRKANLQNLKNEDLEFYYFLSTRYH